MAGFNLAQAIHGQVDAASVVALELTQTGEATERTLEEIAADIVRKDQQVGLGLISIGNDLIEAKAKVEHGKWREWLDLNVGYSERKAQMCMQIARRYGSNPQLVADLGIRKVTALMLLPAGEDAEFLETHDVPNMSTRELEDAIRERDEARKTVEALNEQVKTLEEHNTDLETRALDYSNQNDDLKERIKELESAPKELYKDEDAIKKAADEARAAAEAEMQKKVDALKSKLKKAEEKAELAGAESNAEATKAKAEADRLRAELEAAKRESAKASISGDADLAAFQLLFEAAQEHVNKMRGILLKVRGRDEALAGKLTAALTALADAVKRCAA